MESLTATRNNTETLLLPTADRMLCLNIDSIIRVEASSNYSKVYCKGQRFPIVVAKVLRWFENNLPQQLFTRIHRGHLINKTHLVAVRNNNVILESGMQITISRRKRKSCLAMLS